MKVKKYLYEVLYSRIGGNISQSIQKIICLTMFENKMKIIITRSVKITTQHAGVTDTNLYCILFILLSYTMIVNLLDAKTL